MIRICLQRISDITGLMQDTKHYGIRRDEYT